MSELDYILSNHIDFLKFLKMKLPLYHASNVFFRDIQYGIVSYVEDRMRKRMKYNAADELTHCVVAALEERAILRRIDKRTWLLNFSEFALRRQTPAAKPVAAAPKTVPAAAQQVPS